MERLQVNLSGKVRRATLNGKEYFVAPVTMIVPGVLNGSKGALYYPLEEIARNVDAWNGMPLVVYHPEENGINVSARSPAIINRQGVGQIFNATILGGKLKAEAWFDIDKTRQVNANILHDLEAGRPIEQSTGLFTENEAAPKGATHNGRVYDFIARNYRPDHLAILPGQTGACSVQDGCGVNVNAEKCDECGEEDCECEAVENEAFDFKAGQKRSSLYSQLRNTHKGDLLIHDMKDGACVYEHGGKMLKTKYDDDGENITLSADAAEEVKVIKTHYRKPKTPKVESEVATPTKSEVQNKEKRMKVSRAKMLAQLATNCKCDEQKATLNGMTDKQLEFVANAFPPKKGAVADDEATDEEETGDDEKEDGDELEDNKKGKAPAANQSEQEWLAKAPASVREDLAFARNAKQQIRSKLIGKLTANAKSDAAKKAAITVLANQSLEALQVLADAMPEAAPEITPSINFYGAQGGMPEATQNISKPKIVAGPPVLNYEEIAREERQQAKRA